MGLLRLWQQESRNSGYRFIIIDVTWPIAKDARAEKLMIAIEAQGYRQGWVASYYLVRIMSTPLAQICLCPFYGIWILYEDKKPSSLPWKERKFLILKDNGNLRFWKASYSFCVIANPSFVIDTYHLSSSSSIPDSPVISWKFWWFGSHSPGNIYDLDLIPEKPESFVAFSLSGWGGCHCSFTGIAGHKSTTKVVSVHGLSPGHTPQYPPLWNGSQKASFNIATFFPPVYWDIIDT